MLGTVTGMESTYLTMVDPDENRQHVRFARNVGERIVPEGITVPRGNTPCKQTPDPDRLQAGDAASSRWDAEAARLPGMQTYISAPVCDSEGRLLGSLCAASGEIRAIPPNTPAILTLFSTLVANFIERESLLAQLQESNERLRSYAMTDPLTGLANRRALLDELRRLLSWASREQFCVLVALIDLDNFKRINDDYGHVDGDRFLQAISQRLQARLRESDMLGRLGGDEFLLVGPGPAWQDSADRSAQIADGAPCRAARRLQQRVAEQTVGDYPLGQGTLHYPGASVGVVAINPQAAVDAEQAIRLADAAMYAVKRQRKGM